MKKIGFGFGLLLLVSLFSANWCAAATAEATDVTKQEAKKHATKEAKKESKKTASYLGEVTEVDTEKNRMLLAKPKSSLAMVLNTSRATFGPGYSKLEEVKVGDQVEVTVETKVGTMYALTVAKGKRETAQEPKKEKQKLEKPKNHP